MRASNKKISKAMSVGRLGTDFLSTGTLTAFDINGRQKGWYAFVVGEAATVTAVTFIAADGTELTNIPTWKDVELPAGSYWSAGFIDGKDAFISSITLSSGSVALYLGICANREIFAPNLTVYEEDEIFYKYSAYFNIDAQRDNIAVGWKDGYLYYSDDNSITFEKGAAFPNTDHISFSFIFGNGNILFGTNNKIYLSTDELRTFTEKTVIDTNGDPVNMSAPGSYFRNLQPDNPVIIDGVEHLVFGSYTNVADGNSQIYIFHTYDSGETLTVVYEFGQNPSFGNYGDALNPIITKHVHAISYNSADGLFWIQTGDSTNECHWIKGIWDGNSWAFTVEETGDSHSWYKTVGFYFKDGYAWWGSDSGIVGKVGVFKVAWDDIGDPDQYVTKYLDNSQYTGMLMNDDGEGIVVYAHLNTTTTRFSFTKDFWETGTKIGEDVLSTLPTNKSMSRIWPKNNDGYYLIKMYTSDEGLGARTPLMVKLK